MTTIHITLPAVLLQGMPGGSLEDDTQEGLPYLPYHGGFYARVVIA